MFYLPEDNLYLTRYRAYDAAGHWLSRDPIAEQGGINLYGYVEGNPVNFNDPLGLVSEEAKKLCEEHCDSEDKEVDACTSIEIEIPPLNKTVERLSCECSELDRALSKKASDLTTPGTKKLEGQYINDQGRIERWKAHYDEYGRQIGRTDYNAGNKAQDIPDTHHHTREYNAQFPDGRSTGDHLPGEYVP